MYFIVKKTTITHCDGRNVNPSQLLGSWTVSHAATAYIATTNMLINRSVNLKPTNITYIPLKDHRFI